MRNELESQILKPAIDLALSLRLHQPPLFIGIPHRLDDLNCSTTIHDPDSLHSNRFLIRHEREKIYDIHLMVRPALMRAVEDRNGNRQLAVVKCERFTIVTKGSIKK